MSRIAADTADTQTLTESVVAILESDEWTTPYNWKNVGNLRRDPYGNEVAIHEQGETVKIEFTYALPGSSVEVLHLDPSRGAHRIAMVIESLAAPEI